MKPSTVLTSCLPLLSHVHARTTAPHHARDAESANIPAAGINITVLAEDPDRLHDAFTSYATRATAIAKRAYADTANELTDGTACRDVTLIYARGTTQDGNIGASGDVGPLFMNNLSSILGASALAVQGVDYDASILGFLAGGDADGSQTMADLVALANTQCPSTKIVMSGYSQGGQLVHNAASLLESNTAAVDQVAAVLIFGDPDEGDPVGSIPDSKVKVICHDGDNICDGGILVLPAHLNYQNDAATAAEWVASMVE